MIVQCPSCGTRFRLPDERMKPTGVKVRCSRCAHVFVVQPDGSAHAPGGAHAQLDGNTQSYAPHDPTGRPASSSGAPAQAPAHAATPGYGQPGYDPQAAYAQHHHAHAQGYEAQTAAAQGGYGSQTGYPAQGGYDPRAAYAQGYGQAPYPTDSGYEADPYAGYHQGYDAQAYAQAGYGQADPHAQAHAQSHGQAGYGSYAPPAYGGQAGYADPAQGGYDAHAGYDAQAYAQSGYGAQAGYGQAAGYSGHPGYEPPSTDAYPAQPSAYPPAPTPGYGGAPAAHADPFAGADPFAVDEAPAPRSLPPAADTSLDLFGPDSLVPGAASADADPFGDADAGDPFGSAEPPAPDPAASRFGGDDEEDPFGSLDDALGGPSSSAPAADAFDPAELGGDAGGDLNLDLSPSRPPPPGVDGLDELLSSLGAEKSAPEGRSGVDVDDGGRLGRIQLKKAQAGPDGKVMPETREEIEARRRAAAALAERAFSEPEPGSRLRSVLVLILVLVSIGASVLTLVQGDGGELDRSALLNLIGLGGGPAVEGALPRVIASDTRVSIYPPGAREGVVVVSGRAHNDGVEPLRGVEVVAQRLDGGAVVEERAAWLGLPLPVDALARVHSQADLDAALWRAVRKLGRTPTRLPLSPGQSADFMVVFPGRPEGLDRQAFRVEFRLGKGPGPRPPTAEGEPMGPPAPGEVPEQVPGAAEDAAGGGAKAP